ncbi:MAG: FG-GAP-like repeat-containing protein, partial [Tannerella sp.]|nr:FG-GAP-like repeat-containing protein [Tannerella sp.]
MNSEQKIINGINLYKFLKFVRVGSILFALLFSMTAVKAQDTSFWFAAPDWMKYTYPQSWQQPVYFMITTGDEPATVTMTMPAYLGSTPLRTLSLPANSSQRLIFGSDGTSNNVSAFAYAQMDTIENTIVTPGVTGVKYNRGIHFSSTAPVFIYYCLATPGSRNLMSLKGEKALGTSFFIPTEQQFTIGVASTYPAFKQFHVVATENNTSVTITPTSDWYGGASGTQQSAGTSYTVTLQKGETVPMRTWATNATAPKFAGSTVTSTKPVAVTVGEDDITLPTGPSWGSGGDPGGDQIVSVDNLGRHYLVIRGYTDSNQGDYVYILATQANTTVTLTPQGGSASTQTIASAGGFIQYHLNTPTSVFVSADHPVYVWQQSGVGGEADCVLVPSMYSINARSMSFYRDANGVHYLFVLVRSGNEGNFRVNGSATILQASDFTTVTGATDWKYARKQIDGAIAGNTTVRVTNSTGSFSLGYFSTGGTPPGIMGGLFGYLSAYGDFEFPDDTVYICAGDTYILDGGYALDYDWTLPDGSHVHSATATTLTASQSGLYKLTLNQDPHTVSDSIWVLERFRGSAIILSSPLNTLDNGKGTRTYSVDLAGQGASHVRFQWKIDGVNQTTAPTMTHSWEWEDEALVSVLLEDTLTNCSRTLYFNHAPFPDNVEDAHCYTTPPATVWDIERKMVSDAEIHSLATPFAGDIDGDGHVEVVVPTNIGYSATASNMLIFDDNLHLKRTVTTPTMPEYNTMTNLIADVDNDGYGEIVVATTSKELICYSYLGVPKWTSNSQYTTSNVGYCPSLIVADINGDGYCEILAVDKLYDGETGHQIATLPSGYGLGFSTGGPESWMPVFADIDNDGIQEIVAGNTVYKISSIDRSVSNNPVTVLARITTLAGGITAPDGFTAVADVDLDGDLDVIVTGGHPTSSYPLFYVWDGATGTQIGNTITFSSVVSRRISRPFAGDINADGRPDIAFTYTNRIAAYSYNSSSNIFDQIWQKTTSDNSGATTMSMFDFNMDGEVELVYRDMTQLRIINKNGNDTMAFACGSATHTEYPIVVDLDRDGHADILVSGQISGYSGTRLVRYGSVTEGAWAPARSVWNQHGYNATNINDDLTVPRFPLNNATVFPGADGVLNTGDDIRPYNNFLQQQTPRSVDGRPIWTLPNAEPHINANYYDYFSNGDSLIAHVTITNTGDNSMIAPLYLAAYKNTVSVANVMAIDSLMSVLHVNETLTASITIRNLASYQPYDSIVLRINDRGTATYIQEECDSTGNEGPFQPDQLLRAFNDYVSCLNYDTQIIIDELVNDSITAGTTMPPTLITAPAHGTATVLPDNTIRYEPAAGFQGIDSVDYRLTNGTNTSTARIYILVSDPLSRNYIACDSASVTMGFNALSGITYRWYNAASAGTLLQTANTLTIIKG